MVKLLAHRHMHMPMRMHGDAMLPFVEKACDETPENETLWRNKPIKERSLRAKCDTLSMNSLFKFQRYLWNIMPTYAQIRLHIHPSLI